jgi:hypothetical protein
MLPVGTGKGGRLVPEVEQTPHITGIVHGTRKLIPKGLGSYTFMMLGTSGRRLIRERLRKRGNVAELANALPRRSLRWETTVATILNMR